MLLGVTKTSRVVAGGTSTPYGCSLKCVAMMPGWETLPKAKATIFHWHIIKVMELVTDLSLTSGNTVIKVSLRCNVAIDRISQTELTDTETQNRLVAEARFLRAYYYFELVRNFGGVPLMTGFLLPEEVQGITRASEEEVYAFIEEDLQAAAEVLPERSEYAAADMGRDTRGAALGLLGKVYLYQEKWQEAHDVLQTVINSREYDLLPEFGQVWDLEYDNSIESLFEVQYEYHATLALGGSLATVTGCRNGPGDGWSWCQPTANLEQAYH